METLNLPAYAKINLTLDVGPLRMDGYHEICSVLQTVSLSDELVFTRTTAGVSVTCDAPGVPAGADNLASRALERLVSRLSGGVRLIIHKRIPVAAGLGGGSSDAAATLKGVNQLYGLGLGEAELLSCAAELGSDVPFFILGGAVLARGRGELITHLQALPAMWLVLAYPGFGVSTGKIYAAYSPGDREPCTPRLLDALADGNREEILKSLGNDLESVTIAVYPEVGELKTRLEKLGAERTLMTGSGTAVFGVFPGEKEAAGAALKLREANLWAFVCKTVHE